MAHLPGRGEDRRRSGPRCSEFTGHALVAITDECHSKRAGAHFGVSVYTQCVLDFHYIGEGVAAFVEMRPPSFAQV